MHNWSIHLSGQGGHGHTYPGAVMPFGMVQLSLGHPSDGLGRRFGLLLYEIRLCLGLALYAFKLERV